MSQVILSNAICLKTTPYREADVIAAFFTAEQGLQRIVCKGIKKPKSKLAGACQPMTLNRLTLLPGRNMATLQQYARLESFDGVRQDLNRLGQAMVWMEIVYLLGEETDAHSIFDLLSRQLGQLSDLSSDWLDVTVGFHKQLLAATGYGNDWTHCMHCDQELLLASVPFLIFTPQLGGFICTGCQSVHGSFDAVKVSPETLALYHSPVVYGAQAEPKRMADFAQRLQSFLNFYWTYRLERPLKSLAVVSQLSPSFSQA